MSILSQTNTIDSFIIKPQEDSKDPWGCNAYITLKNKRKKCGKTYKRELWLRKHIKEKHLNEKKEEKEKDSENTTTQLPKKIKIINKPPSNQTRLIIKLGEEINTQKKLNNFMTNQIRLLTSRLDKVCKTLKQTEDVVQKLSEQLSSKREENESLKSYCLICWDNPNNHAFLPCGHKSVCGTCAALILTNSRQCPICRAAVNDMLQIWD